RTRPASEWAITTMPTSHISLDFEPHRPSVYPVHCVAALSTFGPDAHSLAERFRPIRELAPRPVPAWAAQETLPDGRRRLVVVQRVVSGRDFQPHQIEDWVRDARYLTSVEHPNVVRIRDVISRDGEAMAASDFLDAVTWSELRSAPQPPSLEM